MDTTITTPRGPVSIRAAREDDAAAYRELRLEALYRHPEAFSSDYEESAARPESFWLERLRRNGADDGVMMYFAVWEGELLGMTAVARTNSAKVRHSGTIVSVYVRPEWRGLRIADALIEACLEWGRARGVTIAKLGVTATNVSAIRCYLRCGFQVYGVDPQAICHEGVCYDELLMAKLL